MASVTTPAPATTTRVIRPITLTLSLRGNANADSADSEQPALTRWETFRNQPHLVAPLVGMIGDSVVLGMSAEGPEFVSGEVLALLPEVWNGCPICLTHPNGVESACTPDTLSLYQFGVIFNARYENNALQMEAWLSPNDAETVSPDATDCINRILMGEPVEISICPWVRVSKTNGISPRGVAYEYRWEEILGADHVAILPSSMRGACSVDMGCGTPRALSSSGESSLSESGSSSESGNSNSNNENENTGGESMADVVTDATATTPKPKTGFLAGLAARLARIGQFLSPQADDGTGVSELWSALDNALRATEPGYEFIHQVYTDTNTVVYACYPGREWKDYRRTYSVDGTGNVTLNDDRVEAVYRGVWEPVESSETVTAVPASNAQCSCGRAANATNANHAADNENVTDTNNEEETMANETAPATANANANATTPPAASTAPAASTTPATSVATSSNTANTAPNVDTPATPSIDRAALLSTLGISESDLAAIRAHSAAQTDRKQVLVSALAEVQDTFTAEQLNAMDTGTLEGIADLVAPSINLTANANAQNLIVGDFRGARPRSVTNTRNETYTPPDPLGVNKMLYGG